MQNLLALRSPKEFMKIYSPIREAIVMATKNKHALLPRKLLDGRSKVARIIDKNHLETNGVFDPEKIVVFDNRQSGYRFSGGRSKSFKPIDRLIEESGVSLSYAQPGTYVAHRGNNGLFSTLTSERAFYRKPEIYEQLLSGDSNQVQEYFDFEGLMSGKYIIQHDVSSPIPYIDLEDMVTREAVFSMNREPVGELLRLYKDFGIHDLPHPDDLDGLIDFFVHGDTYDFSQAFGNAVLETSTGIQFSSARAKVAPVQQYFSGAGNMVLPNSLFGHIPYGGVYYELKGKEVIKYTGSDKSTFAKLK
jgi:hypothetical protein